MFIEKDHIYHIYNQGNNRQQIFFNRENYLYFLRKMKEYILPYGDIMAWCLMPNHFHWMVYVRETTFVVSNEGVAKASATHGVTLSHPVSKIKGITKATDGVTLSHPVSKINKTRSFNDSIGILLRSYTRAVNKQETNSGALFREATKAECLTAINGITPSFYITEYGTIIDVPDPEKEYPQICFNYIHNNPVKAGLVNSAEDWEFSSYQDICGIRNGKLINRDRINEFGLTFSI